MSSNNKRSFNQAFNSLSLNDNSRSFAGESDGAPGTSPNHFLEDSRDIAVAKMFIVLKGENGRSASKPEKAHSSSISNTSKKLSKKKVTADKPTSVRAKNASSLTNGRNAKLSAPKKMTDLIKSVIQGHLELTMKKFVGWSFLFHDDYRHIFVSDSYNIGGYPFHIEINSNPMAGHPGKSNEYFAPFHRRFGILLVCDYAFPDPTLRLASNFVITLKAKNSKYQDHRINCSGVFSTYNKSGGTLVSSSFAITSCSHCELSASPRRHIVHCDRCGFHHS
ncbi:hypothetical protein DdX_19631 [Ditylenchus destructor]|uniref:Uncharacterized protein n=1 Tax=Ditylenchus destructor TaxID=166010 RepID=A0AAD4MHK9_9BILA|nr:hypothetical protein DdX_19631 [Ditylenchus destructor]